MPEDGLKTGRNMQYTYKGKQFELKYACAVLDSVSVVYLATKATGLLPYRLLFLGIPSRNFSRLRSAVG